jgi:uncharacterized protein (DUF2147 family)
MYRLAGSLLATLLTAGAPSHAVDPAQGHTPTGVWLDASERIAVEIAACGEELCGKIVWVSWLSDPAGLPLVDVKNSNPTLRTRPLVGLTVLRDFRPAGPRSWEGTIYNPIDGRDYTAGISIEEDGRLRVRAFVLLRLFGQTHRWQRVDDTWPNAWRATASRASAAQTRSAGLSTGP